MLLLLAIELKLYHSVHSGSPSITFCNLAYNVTNLKQFKVKLR